MCDENRFLRAQASGLATLTCSLTKNCHGRPASEWRAPLPNYIQIPSKAYHRRLVFAGHSKAERLTDVDEVQNI